jgi:hypothetical protein
VAALLLCVLLHVLAVYVGVGLQQLLVETGFVERFQVYLDRFHAVLKPPGKHFGVEDEGEEVVDLVCELLETFGQFRDEGVVNETQVEVGEMTHNGFAIFDYLGDNYLK